jgi:hypothetical protein
MPQQGDSESARTIGYLGSSVPLPPVLNPMRRSTYNMPRHGPTLHHAPRPAQVFTLDDACQVVNFAATTPWVRATSFWSVNRDNFDGTTVTSPKSSGVPQVLPQPPSLLHLLLLPALPLPCCCCRRRCCCCCRYCCHCRCWIVYGVHLCRLGARQ